MSTHFPTKAPKPQSLNLRTGSSVDYETIPSLGSSSPYYYKASDIQEIVSMFAEPDSQHPRLSTLRMQDSPSSSHDYESLPSSLNQGLLARMGSEDYTRIGPAPSSGANAPTSPPWIPEGGKECYLNCCVIQCTVTRLFNTYTCSCIHLIHSAILYIQLHVPRC